MPRSAVPSGSVKSFSTPHHIDRKLHEARYAYRHHIACPAPPYGRQTGTVRHIEQGAQLVLQVVCCPIAHRAATRQIVVRQRACPHDLCAPTVVRRIFQDDRDRLHRRAQDRLGHGIRDGHIILEREVSLHRVHHNIRHAARRLIGGERVGVFGVHNGKAATRKLGCVAALEPPLFVRNNATVRHLAAGGGNRQHTTQRQAARHSTFAVEQTPYIPLIGRSEGDCLRRVDHAAAPDGQDEVNGVFAAKGNTLTHQRKARIGNNTAQLAKGDPRLLKVLADLGQQSRAFGTLAAVVEQDLRAAIFLDA